MNITKLDNESVLDNMLNGFLHEEAAKAKFVAVMYDQSYYILEQGEDDYCIFADKDYQKLLSFSDKLEELKQEVINSMPFKIGGDILQSDKNIQLQRGDGTTLGFNGTTLEETFKVFSIEFKRDKPGMSLILTVELSKSFDDFFKGDSKSVQNISSFLPDFQKHLDFVSKLTGGTVLYDIEGSQYYIQAKGFKMSL